MCNMEYSEKAIKQRFKNMDELKLKKTLDKFANENWTEIEPEAHNDFIRYLGIGFNGDEGEDIKYFKKYIKTSNQSELYRICKRIISYAKNELSIDGFNIADYEIELDT